MATKKPTNTKAAAQKTPLTAKIDRMVDRENATVKAYASINIGGEFVIKDIAVVDGLYKLTSRQSLRLELQYLYSPFATQETINPNTGMPESSVFEDKKNRGSWWAASKRHPLYQRRRL